MHNFKWRRAVNSVITFGFCTVLTGCGAIAVQQESTEYQDEMANKDRRAIVECINGKGAFHDHRLRDAKKQDCYLALISGETTVFGEPPQRTIKPDADREAEFVLTPPELARMTQVKKVVGQIAWPALLSNMVYRGEVDAKLRSGKREACEPKDTVHPLRQLNARAEAYAKKQERAREVALATLAIDVPPAPLFDYAKDHWEPFELQGVGCEASDGLFYETFVRKKDGKMTQAFIVFRGTENYRGQRTKDWPTNFAMAMNHTPKEFETLKEKLPDLVNKLLAEAKGDPDFRIYSTGHSLGGGLAQLATYLNENITTAYVFNTSPVTGWTWLRRLPEAKMVEDPQVVRVAQAGEALKYVRNFTDVYSTLIRRTGRMDIGFDFPASRVINSVTGAGRLGTAASLHSMALLSCNLAARVHAGVPSAFGYAPELAYGALEDSTSTKEERELGIEGLCEVPTIPTDCVVDWIGGKVTGCTKGVAASEVAYRQDD